MNEEMMELLILQGRVEAVFDYYKNERFPSVDTIIAILGGQVKKEDKDK